MLLEFNIDNHEIIEDLTCADQLAAYRINLWAATATDGYCVREYHQHGFRKDIPEFRSKIEPISRLKT